MIGGITGTDLSGEIVVPIDSSLTFSGDGATYRVDLTATVGV